MSRVPRALPLHLQPPPSVPRDVLAGLGIQYLSPMTVQNMLYERRPCAIVDLRDSDFVGGHIPGCTHIASKQFYANIDGAIARLQHAPLVIFHCLISMHRAPMCAKLYKERLLQLGRSQDVAILEGGFSQWRELFSGNPQLIEDETIDSVGARQQQHALGFELGQQFVQDVRNNSYGSVVGSFAPSTSFGSYVPAGSLVSNSSFRSVPVGSLDYRNDLPRNSVLQRMDIFGQPYLDYRSNRLDVAPSQPYLDYRSDRLDVAPNLCHSQNGLVGQSYVAPRGNSFGGWGSSFGGLGDTMVHHGGSSPRGGYRPYVAEVSRRDPYVAEVPRRDDSWCSVQ